MSPSSLPGGRRRRPRSSWPQRRPTNCGVTTGDIRTCQEGFVQGDPLDDPDDKYFLLVELDDAVEATFDVRVTLGDQRVA
ncbi:MAG: hypothetical protein FWD63_05500 [Propionibacteriaceae bacterium]|nr:hypothetical protein [Propionibacteriaceae bacterium]